MLDKEFIKDKINLILRDLENLKEFAKFTFDEMARDEIRYAALKNFLMEIIGRAIDINGHILGEKMDLKSKLPLSYKETFLKLGELKILPSDFADGLARSAGFRNAVVHDYNNLDKYIIYNTIGEAIEQYSKYCQYIWDYLKKNEK